MRWSTTAKIKQPAVWSALLKLLVLGVLALGAGACSRNKIIKYDTGINNLKNEPQDTKQDQKREAAQVHTELGAQLMARGDLKSADQKFEMAIGFDPDYIPAHTMLAILDERVHLPQQAEQEYRRALAIDPKNGDTNNNLGYFLCHNGREKEAMAYFQRALSDPFYSTPAKANTNAGECLARSGDNAGAEGYLRKALSLDPNYPDALYQMAHVLYASNDAFHARAFLQRFEAQGQATPDSLLLGYQIESRLGDADAARNYANRLRDQFPESDQAQQLAGSPQ
ncbi:MAG TPA: type IV pilus biogenesis/stability protein PilW [Rhodanobacteraceae bacterium]|nr:type IV pilus biogenesis/stability protein PilW [Rhodanobacteraceae bacterium]